MQLETTRPTIPFPTIDLSSDNPIPEILNAPKFVEAETVIYKTAASQRALISAWSSALIYTLVRNAKPQHVVEIGTYNGGTSDVICQARIPKWADPNKAFDRERTSVPETDFEILRAPRGYSIGSRPVTFGEMPSATEVKGLRIHAETAGGTLHAQCVLRGFGFHGAEEVAMTALDIATPGTVDLMFPEPLKIKGSFERCSAEPWLVWTGEIPLTLSQIPTLIR